MRLFLIITAFLACFGAVPHASAEAPADPYTVSNVRVDITAKSAVAAREKAFEAAQQKAFRQMAAALVPGMDEKSAPVPAAADMPRYVGDLEVTNERLSAVRYVGTYKIRFVPAAVDHFLRMHNAAINAPVHPGPSLPGQAGAADIAMGTSPMDPAALPVAGGAVLVVPVYQRGSLLDLWSENNEWRQGWLRLDPRRYQGVRVPLGDAADMAAFNERNVLSYGIDAGGGDPVRQMKTRYGVPHVVLALLGDDGGAYGSPDAGGAVLRNQRLMIYAADDTRPRYLDSLTLSAVGVPSVQALMDKAAAEVAAYLQSPRFQGALAATPAPGATYNSVMPQPVQVQPGMVQTPPVGQAASASSAMAQVNVRVVFASLQEWGRIRQALAAVGVVRGQQLAVLRPREAVLNLSLGGDETSWASAFMAQGLVLSPSAGQGAASFPVRFDVSLSAAAGSL